MFALILDVDSILSEYMAKDENGLWRCLSCDYGSKNNHNVKHHIESKHIAVSYSCSYCSKTCPTKVAFLMHVKRNHKQ